MPSRQARVPFCVRPYMKSRVLSPGGQQCSRVTGVTVQDWHQRQGEPHREASIVSSVTELSRLSRSMKNLRDPAWLLRRRIRVPREGAPLSTGARAPRSSIAGEASAHPPPATTSRSASLCDARCTSINTPRFCSVWTCELAMFLPTQGARCTACQAQGSTSTVGTGSAKREGAIAHRERAGVRSVHRCCDEGGAGRQEMIWSVQTAAGAPNAATNDSDV